LSFLSFQFCNVVQVWDVVDHAPEVNASVISPGRRASVDAASIDIYRGAHAVILMCDPCRRETLEYCEELLPTIPKNMAVLLLVPRVSLPSHGVEFLII
jgi:hypothetical protein